MHRFLESIPALLAWGTFLALIFFSRQAPVAAAVFIILFDIYWLLKVIYLSLHLRSAFGKMREYMRRDWRLLLEEKKDGAWQNIFHLIIFPLYKEPYEVVRESVDALARANYPGEKLIVVLAAEARAPEGGIVARRIQEEFGSMFFRLLATAHPDGLPGEIPGKGSNEAWACRQAQKKIIDLLGIPYENILVSVFDADTQVFPEYFGALTCHFLDAEYPQHSSYQPIPFFTNNIFTAPALARVISFSSTFWHMMQQARPERLTTFSSHAMPFRALAEIGFWKTNIVSEDSHIFWQCLLHYNGNWRVAPLFYPVSMDANVAPGFWQTMKNLYKQQRRWAWGGCENIPYFLSGFIANKLIPFRVKLYWSFHYIEGFHSWATNSIIIFTMGWLPIVLGGPEFGISILSYNLPRIVRTIMFASMIGIVSSAILSMILLPPKPVGFRPRHYVYYVVQWLLMPFTMIFFGAFPALDAQTRALLGGKWRLNFWFTPKHRARAPAAGAA